jgi:hypothetical protein
MEQEPNPSGAPEAGGATSHGSVFGGTTLQAHFFRFVARWARAVEAAAYRRLRDMDLAAAEPEGFRGRPHRVKQAAEHEHETPTTH